MFYTLQLLQKNFSSLLMVSFVPGEIQQALETNDVEVKKNFLRDNAEKIYNHLVQLDANSSSDTYAWNNNIDKWDFNWISVNKEDIRVLLKEIGFKGFEDGHAIEDIKDKLSEYISDKDTLVTATALATQDVRESTQKRTQLKTKDTGNENVRKNLKKFDQASYKQFLIRLFDDLENAEGITILDRTLTKDNISDMMQSDWETDNDGKRVNKNEGIRQAVYEKYGYKDSRSMWWKFISSLSFKKNTGTVIEKMQSNTAKVDLKDVQSVKSDLFDFDSDGDIDTRSRDAVTESHLDDMVLNMSHMTHLIENIGFGTDLDQIKNPAFKLKFKTRLIETLKMGIPATVLIKEGGYQEYMNLSLEQEISLHNKIDSSLNQQDINAFLVKNNIPVSPESIKLVKDYTIMVSMWYMKGIGINMNIKDITKWVLDSINIWMNSKWEIALSVNKTVFSTKINDIAANVDLGLSPSGLWARGSLSGETWTKLDQRVARITGGIGTWIGFNGQTYMMLDVTIEDLASDNMEGLKRIIENTSQANDLFMNAIRNGQDAPDASDIQELYGKNLSPKQSQTIQQNYLALQEKYNVLVASVNPKYRANAEARLQHAVLEWLTNEMYQQATGFKITGLGAFLIPWVLAWIFPLMEYNSIDYENIESGAMNQLSQQVTQSTNITDIPWAQIKGKQLILPIADFPKPQGSNLSVVEKDGNYIITPENGYKIDSQVVVHRTVEENKSVKYTKLDITAIAAPDIEKTIKVPEGKAMEKYGDVSLDTINWELPAIENAVNFKTRYNSGAKELINPNLSQAERWTGLQRLAALWHKKRNIDYKSGGVGDLGKTWLHTLVQDIDKKDGTEQEKSKLYLLSQMSQYIKKSNDYKWGDIKNWNKNTSKLVNIDRKRRPAFAETLGFDVTTEAEQVYAMLEKGPWKIDHTTIQWVGFDVTHSLIHTSAWPTRVTWVDPLYGKLDILTVDGQPVSVDITDQSKIDAFITKLDSLQMMDADREAFKAGLTDGTLGLKFYKDSHGFNDRIMIVKKESKTTTVTPGDTNPNVSSSWSIDPIKQLNNSLGFLVAQTWDMSDPEPVTRASTQNQENNGSTIIDDNQVVNMEESTSVQAQTVPWWGAHQNVNPTGATDPLSLPTN